MIRIGFSGSVRDEETFASLADEGITAIEYAFTYGVWMPSDEAKQIAKWAKKYNISISVHAPFFVNLASPEPEKIVASKKRVIEAAVRADEMGSTNVVFHAGFYMKRDKKEVYDLIKYQLEELEEARSELSLNVQMAPEVTGKASQFGDLNELLELRSQVGCNLCVDFAHLLARYGSIDYDAILNQIKDAGVKKIHAHFSGIEYTDKGERKHLLMTDEEIDSFLGALVKHGFNDENSGLDITIISESPDPYGDAKRMRKRLEKI